MTPAVATLVSGLVDDAGLFPPASLSMAQALCAHAMTGAGPAAWLTDRFLCPASRVSELLAALGELSPPECVTIGLIADSGAAGLPPALAAIAAGEGRVRVGLVELALPADRDQLLAARAASTALQATPEGARGFVELPRVAGWRYALAVVGVAGLGAKIRCGGLVPEAFPSVAELAAFVTACVTAEVPFKATAGLHHALRHTDPGTGFEHHGFLNLILAVAAAIRGDQVERALAERDPLRVAEAVEAIDPDLAGAVRSSFVAYGSCSVDEPVEDLIGLGLLVRG